MSLQVIFFRVVLMLSILTLTLTFVGCARSAWKENAWDEFIENNYEAAKVMYIAFKRNNDRSYGSIMVKPFVGLRSDAESRFGRVIAQQVSTRLSQLGLMVSLDELKEKQPIIQSDKYEGILCGDYFAGNNVVYINAKIYRSVDGVIVASHSWVLPLEGDIYSMTR